MVRCSVEYWRDGMHTIVRNPDKVIAEKVMKPWRNLINRSWEEVPLSESMVSTFLKAPLWMVVPNDLMRKAVLTKLLISTFKWLQKCIFHHFEIIATQPKYVAALVYTYYLINYFIQKGHLLNSSLKVYYESSVFTVNAIRHVATVIDENIWLLWHFQLFVIWFCNQSYWQNLVQSITIDPVFLVAFIRFIQQIVMIV